MSPFQKIFLALILGVGLIIGVLPSINEQVAPKTIDVLQGADGKKQLHRSNPRSAIRTLPTVTKAGSRPTIANALLRCPDSKTSSHPVESAVAFGTVLASKIERSKSPDRWVRLRLVQIQTQPRPVRVVEEWQFDPGTGQARNVTREMFLADQLIVKARQGIREEQFRQRVEAAGMQVEGKISDDLYTVRLATADLDATDEALMRLNAEPDVVENAEPDGVGFGAGITNDPFLIQQWSVNNIGQLGGVPGADVDGVELWDILENATGIVIAVLDSGLNFSHPDLQNIASNNAGEIAGDGIDDDLNGRIDDLTGWDFVNSDNNPGDDNGHGSNVTGIIAANRNNSAGIAGMIGGAKILVCKILNATGSGLTSHLIAATAYARQRGVPIINFSLQNYPFSNSLSSEFTACQTAGIILCISAGNQGVDNDVTPNYPSSYVHSNIIAVGNHDRMDVRWSGAFNPSNFGRLSVDLFAPGREILAPVLDSLYSSYTGTSQAAPHVTAACAAIKYANPSWTATQIKNSILLSVITRPAYRDICTTRGRFNALAAVTHAFRQLPAQDADEDQFSNLMEYLASTRADLTSSRPLVSSKVNGNTFSISINRIVRTDALLQVETSSDLVSWTTTGVATSSTAETLAGEVSLTGKTKAFLRIRGIPIP